MNFQRNPSKRIWIQDGQLRYGWGANQCWSIDLSTIRIIGEYTDENGPFGDDYHIVFVTAPDEWYEASFYSTDLYNTLSEVGSVVGGDLAPGLCNSTIIRSRVIWPSNIEGQNLFEFSEVYPDSGLIGWLKKIMRIPRVERTLSKRIQTEIQSGISR